MNRREFRRRLAQRPNAVRFGELERLLILYGWELDRTSGSHYIYRRGTDKAIIPFRRPHVLGVYVRAVLKLTEEADNE
jgi:predicted RNA binding protein YcfA (HicA-like mRNA interferase family)